MSAGWDADLVLEMDDTIRTALCIINGERTSKVGAKFNYKTMSWDYPKKK